MLPSGNPSSRQFADFYPRYQAGHSHDIVERPDIFTSFIMPRQVPYSTIGFIGKHLASHLQTAARTPSRISLQCQAGVLPMPWAIRSTSSCAGYALSKPALFCFQSQDVRETRRSGITANSGVSLTGSKSSSTWRKSGMTLYEKGSDDECLKYEHKLIRSLPCFSASKKDGGIQ